MGNRKTRIPAIPDVRQDNIQVVLNAVKEVMEVAEMRRGDPLDAKVTFRDLIDGGLANFNFGGLNGNAGTGFRSPLDPNIPGPGSPFLRPPTYDGLSLPGRPLNVHTMAVWDGIQVIWDWPDAAGTATYWKRAVIWASASPSFEHATIVGYSTTNFFTHMGIGFSAPTIPGVTTQPGVRYYWVAWEGNWNDATGQVDRTDTNPYTHQPGIRGQTALNPEYMLELMRGKVSELHLLTTLNQRIDLVDYDPENPETPFTESVQERILRASVSEDDIYAAIAETATTSVNSEDGYAEGEYTLRVDANGYVAGFGLSAFSRIGAGGEREEGSAFVISADTFAIVHQRRNWTPSIPPVPFEDKVTPFIVTTIDNVEYVGIDGNLIVDGTIFATAIQAGSIGTAQLNAQEIYADLLTTNHLITGTFSTSEDPNFRLEINGDGGPNELYPLWYGAGTVAGTSQGNSQPVFFFDRYGTAKLAGELYVTGAGKFFAGNTALGEHRIEIGGPDTDFLLWAGRGAASFSNEDYSFYVDNEGNAKFKGTVEAQYVSGEISRTNVFSDGTELALPRGTTAVLNNPNTGYGAWQVVGEWVLGESPFDRGHVPYASISFSLYGSNQKAGAARLSMFIGSQQYFIATSVYGIADYGTTYQISGALGSRVFSDVTVRLEMTGYDNHKPTTGSRHGLILGIR